MAKKKAQTGPRSGTRAPGGPGDSPGLAPCRSARRRQACADDHVCMSETSERVATGPGRAFAGAWALEIGAICGR